MIEFQRAQLELNEAALQHSKAETLLEQFNEGLRTGTLTLFVQDAEAATLKLSLAAKGYARACVAISRR